MDVEIGKETVLALCAMAWADGTMDPAEADGIRLTAQHLGLAAGDQEAVDKAIASPMSLDEVETLTMSRLTRLFTYAAAFWIGRVDGVLNSKEQALLDLLGDRLGLSKVARDRAAGVATSAAVNKEATLDLVKLRSRLSAGLSQIGND